MRGKTTINHFCEADRNRVAAYLQDGTEIGETTYINRDGVWIANHSYVNPAHRGKKIAGYMLELLIETAREQKHKIKPFCPYIVKAMEGNEEYADILAD